MEDFHPQDLREGMYLVGRRDGSVSSFFVRILDGSSSRHFLANVESEWVDSMMEDPDSWWWRLKSPDYLPSDFALDAMVPPHEDI